MNKTKVLIVIAGPTAIGKTALAIKIAQYFNTEILSADSRQFFKEMSIGTAKPTDEELKAATHHFINSHSIQEQISVGSYEKEALELLNQLFKSHDVLVMVGGSGLYINAVLHGFDELPPVNEKIRENLNDRLIKEGISPLQQELQAIDPTYYTEVDIHNPQRIIRALEIYHSTGKTFSSFRSGIKKERPFKSIIIGLDIPREELYTRINTRVDLMIAQGLVDEVKALQDDKHLNSLNTVGYSEIFEYLEDKITLPQAIEAIKQNTRRFAKRQLTWFRKTENIHWFNPKEEREIISFIEKEITSLPHN
ncbi:tRNA (adenosine(37)-N6)-dimethylallyltransferase MiaA [Pedobacter glucosidilyticus]|uniref:tRNA (adenosine(37)-N6)-dimethylallyltransferase MiaA n=1 Tax=Pedobacter glucosidilyticus TaxID=1122941 RepID=UPI0026EC7F93|nr:tRNA (adenosine(37)-N6)-dimethylallyltransferase MiaA [Pedobacter glucosidilyticus]